MTNNGSNTNIIKIYSRNNDRAFSVPHCRYEQQKHFLFVKTVSDWNQLDNTIVSAQVHQKHLEVC
jgi:hypothetical protein